MPISTMKKLPCKRYAEDLMKLLRKVKLSIGQPAAGMHRLFLKLSLSVKN